MVSLAPGGCMNRNVLLGLLIWGSGLTAAVCFAQAPAHPIVIQTGTILDGKGGVLKDRQIVIEGSKIRTVAAGKAKPDYDLRGLTRSEERRVGKECRSRWSP